MIEIKNLTKVYDDNKSEKIVAINNLSCKLPSKGLVFIIGKSGCGKSTLLNILGGLDDFNEGEIIVDNKSIKNLTLREKESYRNEYVGFVFQEYNLLENYSVSENIEISLDLQNRKVSKEDINNILKEVELENIAYRKINQLSGGQKQRVAIARALIKKPRVLLCDEPTGSLDSATSEAIFSLLKKISNNNLVIVVTHDKDFAYEYGDRVIELKDGKIIKDDLINENINTVKNELTLNKYHLSLSKSLNISTNYLTRKPFRLSLAIIISIVLFSILSVANIYASYDIHDLAIRSMYKSNNNVLVFEHNEDAYLAENNFESIQQVNRNMTDEDIESLEKKLNVEKIDVVYNYYYDSIQHFFGEIPSEILDKDMYTLFNHGIVEINNDFLERYNFVLYGRLPQNNAEDNEIVVSKYLFELFQKFGYRNENDEIIEINNYEDIIGKKIKMEESATHKDTFEIVGILDTKHSNYGREGTGSGRIITNVFYTRVGFMDDNLYNEEFLRYGFCHGNNGQFRINSKYDNNEEREVFIELDYNGYVNYTHRNVWANFITNYDKLDELKIFWLDEEKTKLEDNQILLPLFRTEIINPDNIAAMVKLFIGNFAGLNYELIRDEFVKDFGELRDDYRCYQDYIIENKINKYQEEFSYSYFYDTYVDILWNDVVKNSFESKMTMDLKHEMDIEIVGFYDDTDLASLSFDNNDIVIIASDKILQNIENLYGRYDSFSGNYNSRIYKYKYAFIPLTNNYDTDLNYLRLDNKKFITESYEDAYYKSNNYYYLIEYELKTEIFNADLELKKSATLFSYLSIGLLILAIGFLYYYFSGLIIDKNKEIGVLRSLGATKIDIIKTFIIEILMISLIILGLSSLVSMVYSNYINDSLIEEYNLAISVINFTEKQVFLIIFLTISVSLVSIMIPLIRILKKKPINVINNK